MIDVFFSDWRVSNVWRVRVQIYWSLTCASLTDMGLTFEQRVNFVSLACELLIWVSSINVNLSHSRHRHTPTHTQ